MLFILLALFIVGPIAEIAVLLTAGNAFGALPVVLACIFTAFLGGFLIKMQGLAALNAAQSDLQTGRLPVDSVVDGALLIVAAPLLMTPGFLTDAAGFLLLVPPIRRELARIALRFIRARVVHRDDLMR
ncbi:FxsA family protein [Hyphococcus sp. DH-69]|uniref:FxsA family protein n=1 Tax=Hyphococcus formosus TaxID=3143534 RepID=UPI00398AAD6B